MIRDLTPNAVSLVCLVSLFTLTGVSNSQAAIGCIVDKFTVHFGDDQSVNVTAKKDTPCIFNQSWSDDAIVESYRVVKKAQNGIGGVYMIRSWGYRPNPGFIGHDSFVIEFSGHGTGHSGISHMFINIEVQP